MNNRKKLYVSIGVILCAMTLVTIFAFRQEAQTNSQVIGTPIVDYDQRDNILLVPNRNPSQQEIEFRGKKNEKYNRFLNSVVQTEDGLQIKEKSGHWVSKIPPIPVMQSDEIIIGVVKTGRAFLSSSKTGIYCEFLVSVENVIKTTSSLKNTDEVTVERAGGTVRFPNGKVQRIIVYSGQEMPQYNGRYVFFLKNLREEKGYSILTGYELTGDKIKALDRVAPYQRFDNENINTFLNKVVTNISNPNLQQNMMEDK